MHNQNPLPDNHQLRQWQENFLRLNTRRMEQASSLMPPRQQRLLDMLPLLLHVNHPQLPGFVDHETPAGIEHYSPAPAAIRAIRSLLPNSPKLENAAEGSCASISALFLMGSLGSLAQSRSSDLDVWVCLQSALPAEQQQRLGKKCLRLEQWAMTQGVELHLFAMDLPQFRLGQHKDSDGEDCGSTQFLLLLDEFYRSALWLAGRWPRWWLIPQEQEQRAGAYWQELLDAHLTRPEQWLDLGDLPGIPADEFLGAALWQLNKGLSNTYKALLKLALCRHYAEQYPAIRPLAWDLKQRMHHPGHDEEHNLHECDAYLLLVRRITGISGGIQAGATGNERRNALICRAFYYKTGIHLSQNSSDSHDWRCQPLRQLTSEWGWTDADLIELDSREDWTPQRIFQERNELVADMLASYRQLSQFSLRHCQQVHINAADMRVLGNRLAAAFDSRPGKIILINPGISPSTVQPQLTLLRYPGVWQLASGRWITAPPDRQILKQSPSLIELLLHCLHNQLWARGTGLHCEPVERSITQTELQQLLACLYRLSQKYQHTGEWQNAPYLRHLHLFINVATDPLDQYSRAGLQKLSDRDDPLNFSASHHNLVASIDLLSINSWNEWQITRFEGKRALADVLPVVMQALASKPRPSLEVHCFNCNRPIRIRQRVLALLTSMLVHQRRYAGPFLFAMGEHWWWQAATEPHRIEPKAMESPACIRLENEDELWQLLARPGRPGFHPPAIDRWLTTGLPLALMTEHMSPQRWQLFYQREGTLLTFYLTDECGLLLRQHVQYSELSHWLLPTLRFLLQLQQRWPRLHGTRLDNLQLFELRGNADKYSCQPRPLPDLANNASPIELTAIFDHDQQPTLYCNHDEFSIWQYGQGLYPAIAERVISLRSRHERYPCYLSDLQLARPAGLLEHWQQKQQLEHSLAIALHNAPPEKSFPEQSTLSGLASSRNKPGNKPALNQQASSQAATGKPANTSSTRR